MAATGTRPAAGAPFAAPDHTAQFDPARADAPARETVGPWLLLAALLGAIAYATFSSGAIGLEDESNLQLVIAAIALPSLAAVATGRLRAQAEPRAGLAIGLLIGFAVWCGLSIAWSIAPDQSWVEANRALAYAMVAVLGIVVGSSLPRAVERAAIGYMLVAVVVALYALGGKVAPWFNLGSLMDLNQTGEFTRLRAPILYANALALFCAMAVPIAIRLAADAERSPRDRINGLLALIPLFSTIVLTYSRGGVLATIVAVGVLVALCQDRARILAWAATGLAACGPALLIALSRDDLTTPNLTVSERTDAGLMVGVAFLIGIAFAVLAARILIRNDHRIAFRPEVSRALPRLTLILVTLVAVVGIALSVANDNAGDGVTSAFTDTAEDKPDDPARLLQTNSTNRSGWWNEAIGAWSNEPLLGHGAGSFPALHLLYRDNGLQVKQPHSVPLEFLSETGLIGAALVLAALGLLGLAGVRRVLETPETRERAFAVALLGGAAAWGVQSLVDWDWDIPAVTLPLMLMLGLVAARPPDDARVAAYGGGRELSETGGARALAIAGGTLLIGLFAISAYLPALSERWTDDALAKLDEGDIKGAAEQADEAMQINPYSVAPVFAAASIADQAGDTKKLREYYLEAIDRQPDNSLAWARLAQFQLTLDDSPGAFRSLRIAQRLDPRSNVPAFLALSAVYDETRSASSTGTPLPLILQPRGPLVSAPPAPVAGSAPAAPVAPGQAAPAPRAPAPAPAPAPRPAPTPAPPQGFRLEG